MADATWEPTKWSQTSSSPRCWRLQDLSGTEATVREAASPARKFVLESPAETEVLVSVVCERLQRRALRRMLVRKQRADFAACIVSKHPANSRCGYPLLSCVEGGRPCLLVVTEVLGHLRCSGCARTRVAVKGETTGGYCHQNGFRCCRQTVPVVGRRNSAIAEADISAGPVRVGDRVAWTCMLECSGCPPGKVG